MNRVRLFCWLGLHQCRSFHWDGYTVIRCLHCSYMAFLYKRNITRICWMPVRSVEDIPLVAERLWSKYLGPQWRQRQVCENADELLREMRRADGEEI